MAYADYDFYVNSFYGDKLTRENANRYLERASDELDSLTFGRLAILFPTNEAHAIKVRKAVCAVADTLYLVDFQRKAVAMQQASDGTYRGAISSMSSGKESISYSNGVTTSVYAKAAADEEVLTKLIADTAAKYLANIPDAKGTNLLYAGV
jgi:hypothetical protein